MPQPRATFDKDHEAIMQKFMRLLEMIDKSIEEGQRNKGIISPVTYFEVRVSALNLLARTVGENSIYYRELHHMTQPNPSIVKGILNAAMTDFHDGFMVDAKFLISAEVFADFLDQAAALLEHDYKDAAAVIIRAVLEDALRRVCASKKIGLRDRAGIDEMAKELTKQNWLTAVQFKEIEAKKEIGNKAAHGRFDEYTREDVVAFHEFVQRFLSTII